MTDKELSETTADIVAAYVGNNQVPAALLPDLIASVRASLASLGQPAPEPAPTPAVNPKKSVLPDYLISLEDGKRYKTLKRHLSTRGMTPEAYRAKWDLPHDYPMVAPNYAAKRSELAKSLGLGRRAAPKAPVKRTSKVAAQT